MTSTIRFLILCVALASSGASVAAPVDDAASAKAHYERATRLYELGEYRAALDAYKAAYLAKADASFLYNLGQCNKKLGEFDQALAMFRQFLNKAAPDNPNRAQAEARIREIEDDQIVAAEQARLHAMKTAPARPPQQQDTNADSVTMELPGPVPIPHPPKLPTTAAKPTAAANPALDVSTQTTERSPASPIYSRWWFWVGIGAVAVAGVVTAVALSSGGQEGAIGGNVPPAVVVVR